MPTGASSNPYRQQARPASSHPGATEKIRAPTTVAAARRGLTGPRSNRKNPRPYDKDIYKARHLIENFYCWLKQFRAIATRYDKTARNFLAAIHLAAAIAWLN
jgi:transposase